MRYVTDLDVRGKRVLLRADLNVPLGDDGRVSDPNRIKEFLPTLRQVTERGGRAVVCSHFGSPGGSPDPSLSLAPVARKMAELLGSDVPLCQECVGPKAEEAVRSLEDGGVLLLENLRFNPGETKNDPAFAAALAKLGDVFVGDAFATVHRAHASMVAVPKSFSEKAAGLLIKKEMEFFDKALTSPKRPLCVVLGGSKVSSKFGVLMNIADKADKLVIGGAMANTFLAAQGIQMGRSLYEPDFAPKVVELLGGLARRGCKVYLPVDVLVGPSPDAVGLARAVPVQEIPADQMALDVGPATSLLFASALVSAETILWNGPMGAFENEEYSKGTTDMVEAVAAAHGLSVVGGGDTDAAIHQMGLAHKIDFVSTGGGAFLSLIEGKKLPGLEALGAYDS